MIKNRMLVLMVIAAAFAAAMGSFLVDLLAFVVTAFAVTMMAFRVFAWFRNQAKAVQKRRLEFAIRGGVKAAIRRELRLSRIESEGEKAHKARLKKRAEREAAQGQGKGKGGNAQAQAKAQAQGGNAARQGRKPHASGAKPVNLRKKP